METRITNEDNGYDEKLASYAGSNLIEDSGKIIYGYISSVQEENRYSFGGSDISVTVSAEQADDTVTTREIQYETTIPEDIPDSTTMDTEMSAYFNQWLKNVLSMWEDYYQNQLNDK